MPNALSLQNIVDVSIKVQASAPGSAAFSVAMILDTENVLNTLPGSTPIAPQIRTYSSIDDMLLDGFLPWHRAYRLAVAIFGQSARPDFIKICGYNATIGSGDPTTFLTAVRAQDPAWYGLLTTVEVDAAVAATVTFAEKVALWCQTVDLGKSVYFNESVGALEKTANANIFSHQKALSNSRFAGFWHAPVQGWFALTLSNALIAANTVTFKLNGQAVSVAFNATNAQTITDVITAILLLYQADGATKILASAIALSDGRTILLQATTANEEVALTDFAITGGVSQALATYGVSQFTMRMMTFSAALITDNSTNVAINGNLTGATVFAVNSDTTMAAIATKLAALAGVGYAAVIAVAAAVDNDRQILLVSLLPNTRLDLTFAAVTLGVSQATIAYAPVFASPDYQASAAIVGECISAAAGLKTWSNRKLALVTADLITKTEYDAILANSANVYAAFSQNRTATRIGTVATGLSIRNRILVDALYLAIQLAVFDGLQNPDLVPQSNPGRLAIKNLILGAGGVFVTSGALESFDCQVPLRADANPVDVSAGILADCTFQAVSSGEIQKVIIKGTLEA